MENKLYYLLFFIFLSQVINAQTKAVFFEVGMQELLENNYSNDQNIVGTYNLYIPISLGYVQKKNKNEFLVGYQFQNLRLASAPRYKGFDQTNFHQTGGPNYVHILRLNYAREIYRSKKNITIQPFGELKFGFIPENKFDEDGLPTDSIYYGKASLIELPDSNFLFKGTTYGRLISSFYSVINLGLNFNFPVKENFRISISPSYSIGLIDFYKVNFWYTDYEKNKSGSAILKNDGSQYGLSFRLTYFFDRNNKQ